MWSVTKVEWTNIVNFVICRVTIALVFNNLIVQIALLLGTNVILIAYGIALIVFRPMLWEEAWKGPAKIGTVRQFFFFLTIIFCFHILLSHSHCVSHITTHLVRSWFVSFQLI